MEKFVEVAKWLLTTHFHCWGKIHIFETLTHMTLIDIKISRPNVDMIFTAI